MSQFYASEWDARVDLAAAHRLAVMYGFHEGIDNHFTLLVPGYTDRFFLAPFGLHWSEVKASDFVVVDFDGNILDGDQHALVEDSAFFIHAPMHASARHIPCILHTHMPYATALSMLEDPELEMVSQNAISFKDEVFYDCEYNGLAYDKSEGERMTAALGEKSVLLLRNHGIVTVGQTVGQAWQLLYFFERTAESHVLALSTGRPLRHVEKDIVDYTVEQFRGSGEVNGHNRAELHFAALKRILDRKEPDYAR
jgi:ribulose-5-phosphate 4-epimerase/fuculose-1-phosphate aldolase